MDLGLDSLVDGQRIEVIQAGEVPFPSHAKHPGEHIFVNCHYSIGMADKPLAELYQVAKDDALKIMRHVAQDRTVRKHVGVSVQIYGHYPVLGAVRPARRRIYGLSVLCRDLPAMGSSLSPEKLARAKAFEESQLDDIAELRNEKITAQEAASWNCRQRMRVNIPNPKS